MCGVSAPKKNNFSVKRGVNISHWLSQSNVRGENRAVFFTEADVKFLSEVGFDHLRLPVDEEQKKKLFLCCIMLCRGVKNIG